MNRAIILFIPFFNFILYFIQTERRILMIKSCKIRCYPNKKQKEKINQIFGACRFVMNLYIEYNNNIDGFMGCYDFAKIITKLKKEDPNYYWLKGISTKALSDALMTQEKSYKNFFRRHKNGEKTTPPRYKSRKKMNKESFFFIKDTVHFNTGKKNVIKIPILKNIRITERNYLPDKESITSGRIIREYDKYYVMFIYDTKVHHIRNKQHGYGIDVGIKNYVTMYNTNEESYVFKHFKDSKRYQLISNKIEDYQRIISKKVEINYGKLLNNYLDKHPGEEPNETTKNIMKGESYNTSQIRKMRKKINRLHQKKSNIRKDFINKLVYMLVVRTKPEYIAMEDLSIKNMLENIGNHDLHRYISESGFYYFRTQMTNKCHEYNVELRLANKFFASSKKCSCCGHKLDSLSLNDRVYKCPECGLEIDRDLNAAINLTYLKKYSIA